MNYELIARKIVDKAVIYINKHPEQKFGAAQIALDTVSVISGEAFVDPNTNTGDVVAWHKELLAKIDTAVFK